MDSLVEQTHLDRHILEEIVATLRGSQRQVVLAGPPGTSKTFIAQCIAQYLCQGVQDRYRLVQFHPSYSYESFIEGLRPVTRQGGISFELEDGVVLQLVKHMKTRGHIAANAPDYLILIDEMNRANLPRVFGELMYLFEYRDKPMRLQYSDEPFSLPPNIGFLGTMNTADRSIRSIDSALRRRFDVFEFPPSRTILERFFAQVPLNVPNLFVGFEALNSELEAALDRRHTIGHAFFMKAALDRRQLDAIWARKIYPLIEEYFFDQPDIARGFTVSRFWPEVAT
jgi:5-methylcytosine-specific restriction endonuclease McrBC GTP-binding regulatory subunit McrB